MKTLLYFSLFLTFSTMSQGLSQTLSHYAELEDKSTFIFRNNSAYTLTVEVISQSFSRERHIINAGQRIEVQKKVDAPKVKSANYQIFYEQSAYEQRRDILETQLRMAILRLPEQYFKNLEMTREDFILLVVKETGGSLLKRAIQAWEAYIEFMEYKAIVDLIVSVHNQLEFNDSVYYAQSETNSFSNSFKEQTAYYYIPSLTPKFILGFYWPSSYPNLSNEWVTKGISGRFGLNMSVKVSPEIKYSRNIRSRFLLDFNYQRMGYIPNKNLHYFAGKPYISSSLDQEYFLLKNTENISFYMNEISGGLLLTNYIGPTFSVDFSGGVKTMLKNTIRFDQEEVSITGKDYSLINDKITDVISSKAKYVPYLGARVSLGDDNVKGFIGYTFFANNLNDEFNSIFVGNSNDFTDQGFESKLASFQDKKINYHLNFGILLTIK